jgi:hypothetical protein
MKIKYCSAPCGSGKTWQMEHRAVELIRRNKKVILVVPTRNLADKIAEDIRAFPNHPKVQVFHKGTVGKSVAKALADYVGDVPDEIQEVVIATHAVLPYIKHFENKHKWHVFVDEAMQVVRYQQHKLPHNHQLITSHLEVNPVNSIYGEVSVVDDEALKQIAQNEDDDEIYETLAGTCRILRNGCWKTFVNLEQYDRLKREDGKILAFHSVLQPDVLDGFASVFMASANFEDSQIYKVWSAMGVQFEADAQFAKGLRYVEHPNGDCVTIYYVTDHQWSRYRRKKPLEDGTTTQDRMVQAAKELFPTGRFLWHANKSIDEDVFGSPGQRLPSKPHGLNSYMDFGDTVFLSSLNPPPDHFRFLELQYGLKGEEVRAFTYLASAYQAIMRSSIRDPENKTPKRILVPDLNLAEYLHDVLPGSKIEKIDIGIVDGAPKKRGRRKRYKDNRERVAAQRKQANEEKLRLKAAQWRLNSPDTIGRNWELEDDIKLCAENAIRLYSNLSTQLMTATFYASKKSSMPEAYASGDIPAFVEFLRDRHKDRFGAKEENILFSPAIFDPHLPTGKRRGRGNILYLQNVVLDFENGDLKPEELPKLFPDLQMVVTNTFDHTWEKPRFRAIIFTDEVMTPEVYEMMYGWIADKLEKAGFWVDRTKKKRKYTKRSNMRHSGLDWHGSYPTAIFYLPCQAANPQDSFFHEHLEGRHPLNPSTWIEKSAIPLQPTFEPFEPIDNETSEVDWAKVESAVQIWRASQVEPRQGHDMLFTLARSLKFAGMDYPQIEAKLRTEAEFAYTPEERKAEIPGLIKDIREYFSGGLWKPRTQRDLMPAT